MRVCLLDHDGACGNCEYVAAPGHIAFCRLTCAMYGKNNVSDSGNAKPIYDCRHGKILSDGLERMAALEQVCDCLPLLGFHREELSDAAGLGECGSTDCPPVKLNRPLFWSYPEWQYIVKPVKHVWFDEDKNEVCRFDMDASDGNEPEQLSPIQHLADADRERRAKERAAAAESSE